MRPDPSPWHRFAASLAGAVLAAAASDPAAAAGPDAIQASSPTLTIEFNSVGPSPRAAGASGVWIRSDPTLSVDCSPPRGCYAKTQRMYYVFSCWPRYAVLTERLSMDLNGTIIKHESADANPSDYDEAAALLLNTFCPIRERERGR